ncbi:MAG TPA: L,D-transpeptidase/peptidoglycan binding protein [Coriobacteriia bacterium]|nr:L,D-transpeptidase/peptidoglycan binding protein [Coriobacteriia bacterium]
MQAPSTMQRTLTVILAVCLLTLSGGMAWAAVNDYAARTVVPSGVTLLGRDISGMSADEVRSAISSDVSDRLKQPYTVVADGHEFTLDPSNAVQVDVDAMVDAAFQPRKTASFVTRLEHDVMQTPLTAEVEPVYTVDQATLDTWIADVAQDVDRKAVNAKVLLKGYKIEIRKSETGRKVDVARSAEVLQQTLTSEAAVSESARRISIPVETIEPKKTEDDLGRTIVVSLSQRRVRLFDGGKLVKTYRCAIGTPAHPTPPGEWKIVQKRYMPTWRNPGSAWAASMPRSIPPGPSNPLGTRAINLSAPGIRFHGTRNIASVGTAASHGCMRMYRQDVEDLYDRVKVGDKVFIVR